MEIGLVSDTHGLLRPQVIPALEGCDLILHAGDVGDGTILDALEEVAPVHAVRGNTDRGPFGASLPLTRVVEAGGISLYVIHILDDLDLDPAAAGIDVVVFGHTHRPALEARGGVTYVNPGSCGPRRFDLPVTLARATLEPGSHDDTQVGSGALEGARAAEGGDGPPSLRIRHLDLEAGRPMDPVG